MVVRFFYLAAIMIIALFFSLISCTKISEQEAKDFFILHQSTFEDIAKLAKSDKSLHYVSKDGSLEASNAYSSFGKPNQRTFQQIAALLKKSDIPIIQIIRNYKSGEYKGTSFNLNRDRHPIFSILNLAENEKIDTFLRENETCISLDEPNWFLCTQNLEETKPTSTQQ